MLTEEEKEQTEGVATPVKKSVYAADGQLTLKTASGRSGLILTIPDFRQLQQTRFSIEVYDMKGRMVANLTEKVDPGSRYTADYIRNAGQRDLYRQIMRRGENRQPADIMGVVV